MGAVLFIIDGPSASGKTRLQKYIERYNGNFAVIRKLTTRDRSSKPTGGAYADVVKSIVLAMLVGAVCLGGCSGMLASEVKSCKKMCKKGGQPPMKRRIEGNYEMNLEVAALRPGEPVKVFFSANKDMSTYAFMEIADGGYKLGRVMDGKTDIWKEYSGVKSLPWVIKVLKKGNYFRFWVNGVEGDIRSPMGEWEGKFDPWKAYIGAEVPEGALVKSFTVTMLPWLSQRRSLNGSTRPAMRCLRRPLNCLSWA